ncbi:uncharacterized protein I206_100464 [Kwoniella pini CBS 10737]|uniref:Nuclear pore protein n=1 Tax=Kwoniella pini CBS 10737 TaxID=1296096 RepID=A0A1B9IE63_9TREE|nr:nuclear pore complex protein Nup93 [Kwoniella pini CBS 10737]OCF53560.1 nuclear pore complex protein Nup93 [Kwoniella pini CBS 10737]
MNDSTLKSSQYGGLGGSTSSRPPANTTLSSLLAQANSLNEVEYDSELPQIRFGIDDIERMSETVAGRGKKGKNERGEGFGLLSNLGVNTSQLTHNISQLPNAAETSTRPRRRRQQPQHRIEPLGDIGPSYGIGDGDIGAWGRNWHEMVILGGIEVQRQRTIKSFQKQFQQRIIQNWEIEKARLLQDELGVTDDEIAGLVGSSDGGLAASALGKSALGASTRRFPMAQSQLGKSTSESREGGLVMHTKMVRYERVIGDLNQRRLRKEPFELCQALEETVKGDSRHPLLPASYHILAYLTYEPSLRESADYASTSTETFAPGEPVQERQYASAYLGDQKSNYATLLRGRLVMGGKRFLERDFERHVEEVIAKNPKEAALGGVPGIRNKIRAFVDVTLRSKESRDAYRAESVNGSLLWAQTYYLVRCGYTDEALNLIAENQQHISRDDWSFPGAFKSALSSTERRLSKTQRDQLYNDFNSHIRNNPNVDQFKYALYKLIGRFELNKKSVKVASTTEDWMWLQLSLVRENFNKDIDLPQDQYDLVDLGKLLLKFGNDKFDSNGTKPLSWFNLLLFTAQFEKAIAYLYSKPQLKTDAVHFAVALSYYGLLRVPSKGEEADLLITDDADVSYLNFARLIKQYISPFFRLEPQTALQYAYLVSLASDSPNPAIGQKQKQLALELVRDIVLSSKSWSKLLGSVRADGTKETGLIEKDLKLLKLNDEADYLKNVVLSAAEQSLLDSSLIDSIELYHLAGNYNKVIESVNKTLGQSLSSTSRNDGGNHSNSLEFSQDNLQSVGLSGAFGGTNDIYQLSQKVYNVYEKDFTKRTKVSKINWETLEILLKLKLGLKQFNEENRPDLALETFKSTKLLPLLDNDNNDLNSSNSILKYSENFKFFLDSNSSNNNKLNLNLDEIILTTMKCLNLLSKNLKNSQYGDHSRIIQLNLLKFQSQCLIQFSSLLRLRLGSDVYRQLSSMSKFFYFFQ